MTTLNESITPSRRLPGLFMAVFLIASIFFGSALIGYIPKLVLGGLVVFVGLQLLADWIYDAWFQFPRIDFLIILFILITIAWQGFLVGVLAGVLVALVLFVISYSRTDVIRYSLTGRDYHSRVTRSPQSREILVEQGEQIRILRLQGFIFFGTANTLLESVRRQAGNDRARYVVLDFAAVNGLDSTGLLSFRKMQQLTGEHDIALILTGLPDQIREQFRRQGFEEQPGRLHFFDNLDRGVEWCEEQILAAGPAPSLPLEGLAAQFAYLLSDNAAVQRIIPFLTRMEVVAGDYLIRQGDAPDYMYFIESGQVTAHLETEGEPPRRLETMQGGHIVGELGLFLGTARTAAVVVDQPGVVYRLSRAELQRMRDEDPDAAHALQRIIILLLSQRLVQITRAIEAMKA